MSSIGGYFGLEIATSGSEFHDKDVIRLNTCRNAFEYLLLANKYRKVYIPFFTCNVMLEPLIKHSIAFEFYNIDIKFEPVFDFRKLEAGSVFLYTNYFGLKDDYISYLKCKNLPLIIDNAQSFYSLQESELDTIYSPRKFFGVSDGAYLYSTHKLNTVFEQDYSVDRFKHLLVRVDLGAEEGYTIFSENDRSLENAPIRIMSNLTQGILKSINYDFISKARISNYSFLDNHLGTSNTLKIKRVEEQVPMVYPYWPKNKQGLYGFLIKNNIYCARYWPNVLEWTSVDMLEYKITNECIFLPIDQRLVIEDLVKMLEIISLYEKG